MGKFDEAKRRMTEEERVISLTVERHKWETEGQSIFGKVKAIHDFQSEAFDKIQKEYIIDTGDNLISVFLNDTVDRQLSGFNILGNYVLIKYLGKIDISNGKKFKKFDIKMIEDKEVN